MPTISDIYIYPVKSLGGIRVNNARLTDRGFEHDRRWMLVDENNQFLTQREYPQMALLQTEFTDGGFRVYHKQHSSHPILIPFECSLSDTVRVQVWDDECEAAELSCGMDQWFSHYLQTKCKLVFMPDSSLRKVDERYALSNEDITNFSDGYPLLIISKESLADLNSRLENPLPMNRFRPNIVMEGGDPYEEDRLEHFTINGVDFYGVKLCARCVITTINQDNTERSKEPLKTLASYRMKNNKIYFGQNLSFNRAVSIQTGDEIKIIERKPAPFLNRNISGNKFHIVLIINN